MHLEEHTEICLTTYQHDNRTPTGHLNNQYTYGVAFMEAPFFLVAHAWDKATGGIGNGYSLPYLYGLKASALFFCLAGLYFLYKILRRYFTATVTLLAVAAILLGTNLLWFTFSQPGMSHSPLFFLYSLLIWLTMRVHESPKWANFLLTGLVAGFITVIRPTDIVCLLIPLLYLVHNKASLLNKIDFIKLHFLKIVCAAVAFSIPIIPQLFYWHAVAGKWIYYSYGNQAFTWKTPHIIEGLFYPHNGWLPYSPVMVFALLGLFCWKTLRPWVLASWALLPLYMYIIYSWYCYYYINGYGSRPMVHMYPLLAISLGAFFVNMARSWRWLQWLIGLVACFMVSVNISLSLLQSKNMLLSEETNFVYNFSMLYKLHMNYNDLVVYDLGELQPDSTRLKKIGTLYHQDFQDSLVSDNIMLDSTTGNKYYHTGNNEFPPHFYNIVYHKDSLRGAKWLRVSGRFKYDNPPDYFKHLFIVYFENKKWVSLRLENKIGVLEGYYKDRDMRLDQSLVGTWSRVYYYTQVPDNLVNGDKMSLSVWNTGKRELYVDDLSIELLE
jgi:hypothetical protein